MLKNVSLLNLANTESDIGRGIVTKGLLIMLLSGLFSWPVQAHKSVVVIPLGGGMPPPFAPLTKGAPPDSDYAIGDLTVIDKITQLEWQRIPSEDVNPNTVGNQSTANWDKAKVYCDGLSLDDHTDWRLPRVAELASLINYNATGPAINKVVFPDTQSSSYWSASSSVSYSRFAWVVNFSYGGVGADSKAGESYVRCVR